MQQCRGKTINHLRCQRKIKIRHDRNTYCWQHRKQNPWTGGGYENVEMITYTDTDRDDLLLYPPPKKPLFTVTNSINECIDPMKLGEYLSRGHFGSVSEACVQADCSKYVVKVQRWNQRLASMIRNEVEILNTIQKSEKSHIMPRFVKACKAGDSLFVIVMERVKGSVLSRGYITKDELNRVIDLIRDLHTLHIVHRDIKWSNILYNNNRMYLADFAISTQIFDPFTFRKQSYLYDWLYLTTSLILNDLPLPPRLMSYLRQKHRFPSQQLEKLIAVSIKGREKRNEPPLMNGLDLQDILKRIRNPKAVAKTTDGISWNQHPDKLPIHVMGANDIL